VSAHVIINFAWFCGPSAPMCGETSPGTERYWLLSVCEKPPGHAGRHAGQYGETWTCAGDTNIRDCIPDAARGQL